MKPQLTEPKIYGLIGYPVRHSLSPLMHNAAFKALGINAEYRLFEINPEEVEEFFTLNCLSQNDISGLNVTIPYKEKVIPFLDSLSDEAKLIGAVNTIKVLGRELEGFNTDGEGFLKHLTCDLGFNPQGKIIAIIGAGGAARAISVYLSKTQPKRIAIYDIDKTRTLTLISHLKKNFKDVEFIPTDSIGELGIENSDLLINATSMGMKETDPSLVEEKFIHKDLLVYDLIYNPKETRLLKIAGHRGARVSNGLGMLLYQGAAAFELWTAQKPPIEIMRRALTEELSR